MPTDKVLTLARSGPMLEVGSAVCRYGVVVLVEPYLLYDYLLKQQSPAGNRMPQLASMLEVDLGAAPY